MCAQGAVVSAVQAEGGGGQYSSAEWAEGAGGEGGGGPSSCGIITMSLVLGGSSPQICTKGHHRKIFVKSYLWG